MLAADLLIDARGPDIRHASGLTAPDAFFYLKQDNAPATVYFDAREFAVQQQRLDALKNGVQIERLEPFLEQARAMQDALNLSQRSLLAVLLERKIDVVRVPPEIGYGWVKALQDHGIIVELKDFARARRYKSEAQLQMMIAAQRVTEGAYDLVRDVLHDSVIDGTHLRYRGEILTSERMKVLLKAYFTEQGYACPDGLIVASGEQSARPHDDGSGPILAHQFIIVDLFPQNEGTGFYADMTRTFVKGKPTEKMYALYEAVREVQREMADFVQVGVRCEDVYAHTVAAFAKRGFETSPERGFMHRTGHGLGLSVHEAPSFAAACDDVLEPGMVMTVEPGLYYPGLGGARIEDVIVFHEDGRKENINQYSKDWILS